jgi:hypothetical protein
VTFEGDVLSSVQSLSFRGDVRISGFRADGDAKQQVTSLSNNKLISCGFKKYLIGIGNDIMVLGSVFDLSLSHIFFMAVINSV